ncbi:MAG: BMP family ABC transporter substrate-binding protein [Solirubrobacterales bacterium]
MKRHRRKSRHAGLVVVLLACAALAALVLSACGGGSSSSSSGSSEGGSTSASAESSGESLKLGYLVTGTLGNKDFFESANEAVEEAEEKLGAEVTTVQGGAEDPTAWEQDLEKMSAQGFDAIITTTEDDPEGLTAVMKKFSEQKYISFGEFVELPNVHSLTYKSNEGGYLSGVLAALITEDPETYEHATGSLEVGFLTGLKLPATEEFEVGFKQGAEATNPKVSAKGAAIGSFSDTTKAYNLAAAMYDSGADVIYSEAGGAQTGIAKAAKEKGRYMIGGTVDTNSLEPGYTIASDLKNVKDSTYIAIEQLSQGVFKGGEAQEFGAGEKGGMELLMDPKYVSEEDMEKVEKVAEEIAAGKIQVEK